MNAQIVQLFGLTMVLFALLIGFTSRWSVFEQDRLEDETANRRPLIEEQRIPRGLIRASDGTADRPQRAAAGAGEQRTFTRTYPTGPLFSHAVGYSFISRGRAGLERSRNDELTGKEDEFANIFSELQSETREGKDVTTTLDPEGQRTALEALGGRQGLGRRARAADRPGARDGERARVRPEPGAGAVHASCPPTTPSRSSTARPSRAIRPARPSRW